MAEPAHSMDMNEECCNDITMYCPFEACTMLLKGKCMETIYLLDRQHHPTYNGTLLQASWHPIGHPMPDYEEHRRCLLSAHCERILCQVQDATVPHCDPEIIPHICPSTPSPIPTTQMMYSTTPPYNQEVSNIPARSAESAQRGTYPAGVRPSAVFPNSIRLGPGTTGFIRLQYPLFRQYQRPIVPIGSAKPAPLPTGSNIPRNPVLQQGQPPQPTSQGQSEVSPKSVAQQTRPPPARPPPEEPNIPPEAGAQGGDIRSGPQPNDQTANKIMTGNQSNSPGTSGVKNTNPGKPPNSIPNMGSSGNNQEPEQPPVESEYQTTTKSLELRPKEAKVKPKAPNPTIQGSSVRASLPQMPKEKPADQSNTGKNGTNTTNQTSNDKNGVGAGRQAGFINGQQRGFTVTQLGISGASTGPPEVTMATGTVGNTPDDWERLDEKILAGGIVGGALLALLMVCLTVCCVKRRRDNKSGASTSSSHRGLHLQYSGFPLDSDMLNDPVYKSSVKSINVPPPIPYRPPAPQIPYINSFREPTNFVGSGGGGVSFGDDISESNDYEELPCEVDPAAREAYEELVDSPKQPTSRTTSNVSTVSGKRHVKIHSVPTLYDVNRKNVPVVKRHSSACALKSNSMRHSGRPLPARPTDSLPRTLESVPREVYEPINDPPHGYEVPVNMSNSSLAMLGILGYPGSGYETGTLVSQGRRHSTVPTTVLEDNEQFDSPDYFVLESQGALAPVATISQGEYLANGHPDSLTYSVPSENSYTEVGHEYLDLERSIGSWNTSNPRIPHDVQL